ncbi:MAG: hypothetical protein ACK5O8_19645 [Pirellula sp.]
MKFRLGRFPLVCLGAAALCLGMGGCGSKEQTQVAANNAPATESSAAATAPPASKPALQTPPAPQAGGELAEGVSNQSIPSNEGAPAEAPASSKPSRPSFGSATGPAGAAPAGGEAPGGGTRARPGFGSASGGPATPPAGGGAPGGGTAARPGFGSASGGGLLPPSDPNALGGAPVGPGSLSGFGATPGAPAGINPTSPGTTASESAPTQPAPPPPVELSLRDRAVMAFKAGNASRAYGLFQAHALHVPNEEAADLISNYRWDDKRRVPRLGYTFAVGLILKKGPKVTELKPIGTEKSALGGSQQGGGGRGAPGGLGAGGFGAPAGSSNIPALPARELSDAAGKYATKFVDAFSREHSEGKWSEAFREYSFGTDAGSASGLGGFAAGFAGGLGGGGLLGAPGAGFPGAGLTGAPPGVSPGGGGRPGFGGTGGPPAGYGGGAGGPPAGYGGGAGGPPAGYGGGAGGPPAGYSGGGGAGGPPAGYGGGAGGPPAGYRGGGGAGGPPAGYGGGAGGPPAGYSGGGAGGPPAGYGGGAAPGGAAPGGAAPGGGKTDGKSGNGSGGSTNDTVNFVRSYQDDALGLTSGSPTQTGAPPGPPPGPAQGGPGGRPGFGGLGAGFGAAPGAAPPAAPPGVANFNMNDVQLADGAVALGPGLVYIGTGENLGELTKKANNRHFDGLIIFEVDASLVLANQTIKNDCRIRVVNLKADKESKEKALVSTMLNNRDVANDKDPDGKIDAAVNTLIGKMIEAYPLNDLPNIPADAIKNKRLAALANDKSRSKLDLLSEVQLYFSKGLIDETLKVDAFQQIAGSDGQKLAAGSPEEKLPILERILKRDYE